MQRGIVTMSTIQSSDVSFDRRFMEHLQGDLGEAARTLQACYDIIKYLEWSDRTPWGGLPCCPYCHAREDGGHHFSNCQLSKALNMFEVGGQ